MNFSTIELAALRDGRTWHANKLLKAHHKLHDLVCDRQDNNCALSQADAIEMLRLMRRFAIVKETDSEFFACSLMPTQPSGDDCLYAFLQKEPNAEGRYETCSATDRFVGAFVSAA